MKVVSKITFQEFGSVKLSVALILIFLSHAKIVCFSSFFGLMSDKQFLEVGAVVGLGENIFLLNKFWAFKV